MVDQSVAVEVPTVEVLGVPVSCLSMDETLARIEGFLEGSEPQLVVTADSSGLVLAQSDAELAWIYRSAAIATPDSIGVVWAVHRAGRPQVQRVSGVDLAERLIRLSAEKGYRVFLLGAAPGVADVAAEKMRLRYPGCNIVGTRHGYFSPDDDPLVAQEVALAKPDVLLVAMGIPRQEKFIVATLAVIGAKVAIGVGGSFDVFSGRAKRAPVLIQRLKLEWLWRTILNPRKFSKAKLLPKFAMLVLRSRR